jgi:D-glycero-beta-D-manno-heptose 1-phosphate adenylyltransferase
LYYCYIETSLTMKQALLVYNKIYNREQLLQQLNVWRLLSKKIVFTNGVFDILHLGHLSLLSQAAGLADIMIVGVNSDASVKRLKGEHRPINDETTRTAMLASLVMTDGIILFEEDTPLELIKMIKPDVLVKGGDYTMDSIVGADNVTKNGGKVITIPLSEGLSTTATIGKITNRK